MKGRIGNLALEAVMVVFAVLVALAVEERRDERQLREFAARATGAVVTEMRSNLEELRRTGPSLDAVAATLTRVVEARDIGLLDRFEVELPEISTAAWRAAEVSQAAPYLDYEWMIRVSRAYEVHAIYQRLGDQVIDGVAGVVGGGPPELAGLAALNGRLLILNSVHQQLTERLEGIVDSASEDIPTSGQ